MQLKTEARYDVRVRLDKWLYGANFVRYEQTSTHPMELTRINEKKLIFSVNFHDIVKTFSFFLNIRIK